jgi:hypothetical protein
MKAVRAKLTPQFIKAHTNVTSVTQMRVEVKAQVENVVQIRKAA